MSKYVVKANLSASVIIGTYEADSEEEAITLAENDPNGNHYQSLCHQCSRIIDLGEPYDYYTEEISW